MIDFEKPVSETDYVRFSKAAAREVGKRRLWERQYGHYTKYGASKRAAAHLAMLDVYSAIRIGVNAP